jgi:hypothetical protein
VKMVQDVVFHTECCTDVVLLDQLGGVHPEGGIAPSPAPWSIGTGLCGVPAF